MSEPVCKACGCTVVDHYNWCPTLTHVSGPPFTVDRYGSFAEAVIAHRDWLSREIEELRRDNVRWENAHKILLAEIERLKRDLERAISNHSADLSSASEPPVARCEHGNPIDPTGGYVCLKCFRAAPPPEGGQ